MDRVKYLKASLVAVLFFVGLKMTLTGHIHISPELSLVVIGGLLGIGVLASLHTERRSKKATN
jgi:tellurite resistance protein TerC